MSGNAQRPALAWLGGFGWAMLHDLPDGTVWCPDAESAAAWDDDDPKGDHNTHSLTAHAGHREHLNNQPVRVALWPDGTSPVPSVDDEQPDTATVNAEIRAALVTNAVAYARDNDWRRAFGDLATATGMLSDASGQPVADAWARLNAAAPDLRYSWQQPADAHRVQPQPDELRAAPSVPPHTLRTLADEVQAAGHTFAANTLRELADGSLVVRTPEIAAALAASPAVPQPDELRALRKLSDAASDGPWEWVGDELVGPHDPIDLEDYPDEDRREYLLAVQHVAGLPNPQPADAALIAAAVNYVRSLLAASPATEARPADDDCERNFCHNGLHHVQTAVDDFDSWPCPKYAAEAIAWYERNRAEAPPAAPDTGQDEPTPGVDYPFGADPDCKVAVQVYEAAQRGVIGEVPEKCDLCTDNAGGEPVYHWFPARPSGGTA